MIRTFTFVCCAGGSKMSSLTYTWRTLCVPFSRRRCGRGPGSAICPRGKNPGTACPGPRGWLPYTWCSVRRRLDSALVCFECRRRTFLGKVSNHTTASASISNQCCFGSGRSRCFGRWPSNVWLRQLSPQLIPYFVHFFLGIFHLFGTTICRFS